MPSCRLTPSTVACLALALNHSWLAGFGSERISFNARYASGSTAAVSTTAAARIGVARGARIAIAASSPARAVKAANTR